MNKPTKKNIETFNTLLKLATKREEKGLELDTYEAWELGTTAQSFKLMCERMQEEAKVAGYEMIYCEGYYTSKYTDPDYNGYTSCKVIFRKVETSEEPKAAPEACSAEEPKVEVKGSKAATIAAIGLSKCSEDLKEQIKDAGTRQNVINLIWYKIREEIYRFDYSQRHTWRIANEVKRQLNCPLPIL